MKKYEEILRTVSNIYAVMTCTTKSDVENCRAYRICEFFAWLPCIETFRISNVIDLVRVFGYISSKISLSFTFFKAPVLLSTISWLLFCFKTFIFSVFFPLFVINVIAW